MDSSWGHVNAEDLNATADNARGDRVKDNWENVWSLNAANNGAERGRHAHRLDHLGDEFLHLEVSERVDLDHTDASWEDESTTDDTLLRQCVELEESVQEWNPLASPEELTACALHIGAKDRLELTVVLIATHAQLTVDLVLLEQVDETLTLRHLSQVLVDQHLELLELGDRLVDGNTTSNDHVLALEQLEETSLWDDTYAELNLLGWDLLLDGKNGSTMDLDVLERDWHLLDGGETVQLGERLPDEVEITSGRVQDTTIDLVTSEVRVLSDVEHIDDVLVRGEWDSGLDASATNSTTNEWGSVDSSDGSVSRVVLASVDNWVTSDGLDQWGLVLQNIS